MTEATARLVIIMSITGASISMLTLLGGGYLVWKARNNMLDAKKKAESYRQEFETFIRRLKSI